MSVEVKLIRVASPAFESLQEQPTTLIDLIEELYTTDYFDSRQIYKAPVNFDIPVPCMIHIDEFTIWLLTDRYEHTALCDAVVAWRDTQELIGAEHGQGLHMLPTRVPRPCARSLAGWGNIQNRS